MSQPQQCQEVVIIIPIFAEEEADTGNKALAVRRGPAGWSLGPVPVPLPGQRPPLCGIITVIAPFIPVAHFSTGFPFIVPFDDFLSGV